MVSRLTAKLLGSRGGKKRKNRKRGRMKDGGQMQAGRGTGTVSPRWMRSETDGCRRVRSEWWCSEGCFRSKILRLSTEKNTRESYDLSFQYLSLVYQKDTARQELCERATPGARLTPPLRERFTTAEPGVGCSVIIDIFHTSRPRSARIPSVNVCGRPYYTTVYCTYLP